MPASTRALDGSVWFSVSPWWRQRFRSFQYPSCEAYLSGSSSPSSSEVRSTVYPGRYSRRRPVVHGDGKVPADEEWLIPDTLGRPYTCDRWNSIRYKVFRQAGLQGDFRILRPSFAMKLKEIGMVLDDRSRLLRHTSTETTAKFYSNMESLEPWARVEERLSKTRLIS